MLTSTFSKIFSEGAYDSQYTDSLRSLRLVSKRLNNLIEPIIFGTITIVPCRHPSSRQICEAILTELTSRKTSVLSRATRKLDIQLTSDASIETQRPWLDMVGSLVLTVEGLRSVQYV